mgnify:CR=1 FL=1
MFRFFAQCGAMSLKNDSTDNPTEGVMKCYDDCMAPKGPCADDAVDEADTDSTVGMDEMQV